MVKLTTKYLFRKISKKNSLQPRKKDEADLDYLKRITHLYLQSQFIDKISAIPKCEAVSVIYLQNNLLRDVRNIENFPRLTHLHLQHNFISKMENLNHLTSLRKLYLGSNEISVVEGLDKLVNLTELHLENQRLPQGETLYFDPLTLAQLGNSLKVLNVSNNNMTSMECLSALISLTKLIIEKNHIQDLDDIMRTLSQLDSLETLMSEGNPVVADRKFLNAVVISSSSLRNLNGKEIDERTRLFIRNMTYNKECHKNLSDFSTETLKSSGSFPGTRRPTRSFINIDSKSSAELGSKLFPILKAIAGSKQTIPGAPLMSSSGHPSLLKNSLRVSRFSGTVGSPSKIETDHYRHFLGNDIHL